ncbi:hypothetical protein [Bombilactobacillus bombi]|nr:hypothetical protein [Bombilactobacillus bombi]
MQLMRTGLIKQVAKNTRYTIIDSLPLPVCQPVRNYSVRKFWRT